jgi:SAM-dependent methyltransferase
MITMPILTFAEFMQTMRGFQESRVLLTAIELDVFTAVGKGATAAEVASRLGTDSRGTETLLNALAAMGALAKKNGIFRNTADTKRHLVAGSRDYARPGLMHIVNLWTNWGALTACVRKGTAGTARRTEQQQSEWTKSFIAAMHRNAAGIAAQAVRAVGTKGVRRLLDVGGGSGAYSIAFAKVSKSLRAEVFDLATVVPIAQAHIRAAGLEGRISTRVGDLRSDEFGQGYDMALLSAICHMLGPEENQDLFRRCWRALVPSGRLVIRDFILGPDKAGPKSAALFAINMLVGTRSGSTYTMKEYTGWLRDAGFASVRRLEPAGDLIVATRK